jgi:hypothetical protein
VESVEPIVVATPKPWRYNEDFGEIQGPNSLLVAIVDGPHNHEIDWAPDEEERRDNARLIAAAHDMHDALVAAERVADHGRHCPICTDIETNEADISCAQFDAMWKWAESLREKALRRVVGQL